MVTEKMQELFQGDRREMYQEFDQADILQKIDLRPCLPDTLEMYVRGTDCANAGELFVEAGNQLDFCTYFNSFCIEKWKKYTNVDTVCLNLYLSGHVEVELVQLLEEASQAVIRKMKCQEIHSGKQELVTLVYPKKASGIISFRIKGLQGGGFFHGGAYAAARPDIDKKEMSLALCICTYHREHYILNTLRMLSQKILNNPASMLYGKISVYVVDNGQTLASDMGKGIHVFPQPNQGGSGGFSRAVLEALQEEKNRYMILMDDDIQFTVHCLERTWSFLRRLRPEYAESLLGGAMLRDDLPWMQHAAGENDTLKGIVCKNRNLDLRLRKNLLRNEKEEPVNYLGWWYCAVPRVIFENKGLSMPFFMQYDDIEFGLRCAGNTKITLNGICVWHKPFEEKRSAVKDYYMFRNRAITHAIHFNNFRWSRVWAELAVSSGRRLLRGNGREWQIILLAGEDFLRGGDWLVHLNLAEQNKVLQEMGKRAGRQKKFLPLELLYWGWSIARMGVKFICHAKEAGITYKLRASELCSINYWRGIIQKED